MTDTNAPTTKVIDETPKPAPAAPKGFDLSAMYEQAERELFRLNKVVEDETAKITASKAKITGARAEMQSIERMLGSKTPKTRKPKAAK